MGPVNRPLSDTSCMGYRRTSFAGLVTGAPGRAAMCSVSSGRAVLQNGHGNSAVWPRKSLTIQFHLVVRGRAGRRRQGRVQKSRLSLAYVFPRHKALYSEHATQQLKNRATQ
jgi:hypothetical protein